MFSFKVLWDLRIVACRSVGRLVLRIRFGSDESKKMILFYPQSRNFSLNGTKVFLKYCGLMKVEQDNSKNVIRGQFHFMLFHKKILRYLHQNGCKLRNFWNNEQIYGQNLAVTINP